MVGDLDGERLAAVEVDVHLRGGAEVDDVAHQPGDDVATDRHVVVRAVQLDPFRADDDRARTGPQGDVGGRADGRRQRAAGDVAAGPFQQLRVEDVARAKEARDVGGGGGAVDLRGRA